MNKEEFIEKVKFSLLGESEELVDTFLLYWTEVPLNGVKMRFQYEKQFYITRRWATWKKNSVKFDEPKSSDFEEHAKVVTNVVNNLKGKWD